jgi:hypothetical protein
MYSYWKESISNVTIESGKTVKVKLEAEVYVDEAQDALDGYTLFVYGENNEGTVAGVANDSLVKMKLIENGTINISDSAKTSKNDVVLK